MHCLMESIAARQPRDYVIRTMQLDRQTGSRHFISAHPRVSILSSRGTASNFLVRKLRYGKDTRESAENFCRSLFFRKTAEGTTCRDLDGTVFEYSVFKRA